jgi:ribonuclease HI
MRVYTDASTDGEFAGLGWLCEPTVEDCGKYEGKFPITGSFTSMECEYYALCRGAISAEQLGASTVYIHSDCTPLVEKMRCPDTEGIWAQRADMFDVMLQDKFDIWKFVDIGRAGNTDADRLAKEALYRARER